MKESKTCRHLLILTFGLFICFTAYAQGNVGIGTTTPVRKLDVAGDINFSGELYRSNILYKPVLSIADLTDADTTSDGGLFIGPGAGVNQTTGFYGNTGIGKNALHFNSEGDANTAIGNGALYQNTTGYGNSASGYRALYSNTTGISNTATGYHALSNNTSGNYNTAYGDSALIATSTGHDNTAMGHNAISIGLTGDYNCAFGSGALMNTGNSDNTGVGYAALKTNTTGTENTALGSGADVASVGLTNATALGANAYVSQSYTVVLGDPDAGIKVGIGTSQPPEKLSVISDDPRFFIGNTDSPYRKGLLLDGNEPDDYVRIHGYDYGTGTNLDINIPSDLLVGVWGGTTSYTLELAGTVGTAAKPGGGTWTSTSDRRLKQDIRDYTDGLDALMQIRPVQFRYTEATGYDTAKEFVGVIAQELQEIAPYMVSTFQKDGEAYLAVDASAMTYVLINAVQEQQAIIAEQQEMFAQQQAIIIEQQAAIEELRNLVGRMYVLEPGIDASPESCRWKCLLRPAGDLSAD